MDACLHSKHVSLMLSRDVVIKFWHGFIDYNYLSLNGQLIPLQIPRLLASNDYNYRKMTKLQITLLQVEVCYELVLMQIW